MKDLIPAEIIERHIYLIRGHKVMFDHHLAKLYGVPAKVLNQAVKRHKNRFPEDFMFRLTKTELENWRSQFVTSNSSLKKGLRRPPFAFTEQGVAMLSSALNSERAIHVNIAIMRAFVKLKQYALTHEDLARKIDALEKKYDAQFKAVFDAIRALMQPEEKPHPKIGFRP